MSSLQQKLAKYWHPLAIAQNLRARYQQFQEEQQFKLAGPTEGMPILALLGVLTGLIAGALVIGFRYALDNGAALMSIQNGAEGFEQLTPITRLLLCVGGAALVGFMLFLLRPKHRETGIGYVLTRLEYHQGHLPLRNAIVQGLTACICLLSGQSMGREGPSVHLGATGGSVLGRTLRIPNNGVRILIGSGVAAAIAAAFDTPLAGVIFAMEVVIMEYTVFGFTPVILAAISATTFARLAYGDSSALLVPAMPLSSVTELPIVAFMGIIIGAIAALFIQISSFAATVSKPYNVFNRMLAAGTITGVIALVFPQVMGIGYDTVDALLLSELGIGVVCGILVAKILATSISVGLGMPAGLIGPTLFIGASAGSLIALGVQAYLPNVSDSGWYVTLGMAAMMAATLQAPLAALIFLLELTATPSILLPGMLAVVTATLVSRSGFGKYSIYQHLLRAQGTDYRNSSLAIALRKVGVASVMDRNFIQQSPRLTMEDCMDLLKQEPSWLLVVDQEQKHRTCILPATDIARHLGDLDDEQNDADYVNLLTIPAKRLDTHAITIIATLQEAHEMMLAEHVEVLYVTGAHGSSKNRIYGVLTRHHIEASYRS